MKVGDLVTWRSIFANQVGVIVDVQLTEERDYRSDDSILVMWSNRYEWVWRKELELVDESR